MRQVIYYCPVFFPENTGYANAFLNLIHAILESRSDIAITVVTPANLADRDELKIDRLNVIRIPQYSRPRALTYFVNQFRSARIVSGLLDTGRYDSFFVETLEDGVFLLALGANRLRKAVVRVHACNETEFAIFSSGAKHKLNRAISTFLLRKRISLIASTNDYHIQFIRKYFLIDDPILTASKHFFVIPNTLNQKNGTVRRRLKDERGTIRVTTLGRMDDAGWLQKGFGDIVMSLRKMEEALRDRLEITFIGDGSRKAELECLCADLKNVRFLSGLSNHETLSILTDSDAILLASRFEGLSMFAVEGLATGNMMILSRTGGLIGLVDENGFDFEAQNVQQLTAALNALARLSADQIASAQARSMRLFEEKFAAHAVAASFQWAVEMADFAGRG